MYPALKKRSLIRLTRYLLSVKKILYHLPINTKGLGHTWSQVKVNLVLEIQAHTKLDGETRRMAKVAKVLLDVKIFSF